jgi:ADP-heptose:LPS heptosyltransferase
VEILILHPGGLGDIILSLPAISLLRKQFPSARFTIAGNIDHLKPVVAGYAECVVSLSTLPLHHLYARGTPPEAAVRFWKSFDRIVSWTGSGDSEFVSKMKQANPNACIASWRPGPEEHRHVSQLFVDSLGPIIPPQMEMPLANILLDSTTRDHGRQWLSERGWNSRDNLIALHPGAGSRIKRWPLSCFISLAQHLALREKLKLLIIEGPAETGMGGQIALSLPATRAILAQSVPLDLLVGLIERCEAFVGNDSGIAHLAAGLSVRSVILFGPTLPQHWAPGGKHVTILRDTHGCDACTSGHGDHVCLRNISVEKVISSM